MRRAAEGLGSRRSQQMRYERAKEERHAGRPEVGAVGDIVVAAASETAEEEGEGGIEQADTAVEEEGGTVAESEEGDIVLGAAAEEGDIAIAEGEGDTAEESTSWQEVSEREQPGEGGDSLLAAEDTAGTGSGSGEQTWEEEGMTAGLVRDHTVSVEFCNICSKDAQLDIPPAAPGGADRGHVALVFSSPSGSCYVCILTRIITRHLVF